MTICINMQTGCMNLTDSDEIPDDASGGGRGGGTTSLRNLRCCPIEAKQMW